MPNARIILFDLAGYGTSPVRVAENDVYMIAGWSDNVFSVLRDIERRDDVLKCINDIEI